MTTGPRGANGDLERVWARTGWSRKELARLVNRRGQSRGLHLNTDASRIRVWFAGQQPQPPVPSILCELFSEYFGYPVWPEDIGLRCETDTEIGLVYHSSLAVTVAIVAELGRNDVRRRNFLLTAPFLAAAVAPSRAWLLATLDVTQRHPGGRVGHAQVVTIREAFALYQEADVMHGGGPLRLAEASGDAMLGAHVLAGMTDQARMLGHPQEALQLATAGRHGLTRAYSPACAADLWALQARAHGALGESREAAHAVAESERAFERIERDNEPEWARFIDPAYLAGEWANAFGDITRPIESTRFARRSAAEARHQKRARRGALSHTALARAALTSGHVDLDAALPHAHRALDLTLTVKSSRCTTAVSDLRVRIQPFHTVTAARDFDERARLALAANH